MRRLFIAFTLAGTALAAPAYAQDEPKPAFDLSAGATVTSDYRFRGISQSNKRPAIQGTLGATHESGFYVGTWASSISNYVAAGSDAEIDLYAGYKATTEGGTTIDGGVLYYVYPGSTGVTTNFFEPYFNITTPIAEGATLKVGTNFAWKQKALSTGGPDKGALYVYSDIAVPAGPMTLTAHAGRSFTKNYITFGTEYWDWSLTASYTSGPATFSLGYVDTDKKLFSYPAGGGKNRNVSKAGVVASVGFAF